MVKGSDSPKRQDIAVRVSLPDDERARKASLAVYAFSQGGKLLDDKPLETGKDSVLRVPLGAEGTNVRLLVGPRLEGDARSLAELGRRGAVERHVRVDLNAGHLSVEFSLQIDKILCWILGLCFVNGTVIKRTALGGQNVDLPVCNATVEVYEVDPIYIILWKLPSAVIDRLREIILHPIPLPDPIPDPLPGPFPGPFPPVPVPGTDPFFTNAQPAIPRQFALGRTAQMSGPLQASINAQPSAGHSHAEAALALSRVESASALQLAARTASDLDFRQALLDHQQLIRPLFCIFYPHFFTMQLVATATTDDCGHFHTFFFKGCFNPDTPDLYFKVKQRFLGLFDITIYAPTPVPCYTWWNYSCGSEVTLITHHPLAQTCPPCAPVVAGDNWVLFVAIGQTSLNAIYGNSSALQGSTNASNRGLAKTGAPFGGQLRPELLFDNSLRESLGVKYYRLFWQRLDGFGNPIGSPTPMLDDVARHYTFDVGGSPVSTLYPLGPLSPPDAPMANLYEIPPSLPPQGVWGPVIAPTDYQNGVFNTALPAPGITYDANGNEVGADQSGKFQIRLELFDNAGNPVDIGALGIRYFVPNVDDLTGTITTVDAATLGLVSGNAMLVTVHVDNNPTFAEIDAPSIGALSADPCCGVLGFHSTDIVTLPWRAKHKNGFATFTFQTKRVDQLVISVPDTPVGLVGNHSTSQNAQTLMDTNLPSGCVAGGCKVAAFASLEYVTAMATDGWQRLSYLDRMDFEAFTLSATI